MTAPDFPDPGTHPEAWEEVPADLSDVPWAPNRPDADDADAAYEVAVYAFAVLALVAALLLLAVAVPLTVAAWRLL